MVLRIGRHTPLAGYTIGVTWVRDFLAAHEDVDVVAATLLPAEKIISG
jgi:uncharacterized protein YjaZ